MTIKAVPVTDSKKEVISFHEVLNGYVCVLVYFLLFF